MSASREKKQRQASTEPSLSPRAQEEQQKEARRKRNTIVYSIIGAVIVILAAILLIWDSGVVQRNTRVATIGGEKIIAPQVAYYYYNNDVLTTAQYYNSVGMGSYFPYYSLSVSPKEQTITAAVADALGIDEEYVGSSFHEYFLANALEILQQECSLRAAAKAAGYRLSEKGKASVDEAFDSLDETLDQYLANYGANLSRTAYLQQVYGPSMSAGKYRKCLENAQLASEYKDVAFADGTLASFSESELDDYYQSSKDELDSVRFYTRYFDGSAETTTDEQGNEVQPTEEETEAAMAEAKEQADAAEAEAQDDLSVVQDNDDYTQGEGILSELTGRTYYDWLADADREPGDTTVVEGSAGYTVVVFEERYLDEAPTVNVRHILVKAGHEDDPDTADVDESTEDPTEEDYAAAKTKAEELLSQWRSGSADEDSFAALAEEHSADPGSNTNGGLYERVYEGRMYDAFNDWIFDPARQSGDVSDPIQNTVSSTKGWHLIYFVGEDEPRWVTTARNALWSANVKDSLEIVRFDDALDKAFD